MADGSQKPIRDVKVGDEVLATDPETGETAARPVTKLIVHSGKHTMVDVRLADGTTITATDRHPFWDATAGKFTYAIDLRPGHNVREANGTLLAFSSTRTYGADVTAYNLTVDGIHTYYAGTTAVLVHNSCGPLDAAEGAPLGERLFTSRFVGVDSRLFGHSYARGTSGLLNRTGSRLKFGWTGSGEFGGGWHLRLGLGRNPANQNQSLLHRDFGSTHVPNDVANDLLHVIREARGLG